MHHGIFSEILLLTIQLHGISFIGLYDTVFDIDHDKERAQAQGLEPNGFNFDGADAAGVDYALNRWVNAYFVFWGKWIYFSLLVSKCTCFFVGYNKSQKWENHSLCLDSRHAFLTDAVAQKQFNATPHLFYSPIQYFSRTCLGGGRGEPKGSKYMFVLLYSLSLSLSHTHKHTKTTKLCPCTRSSSIFLLNIHSHLDFQGNLCLVWWSGLV